MGLAKLHRNASVLALPARRHGRLGAATESVANGGAYPRPSALSPRVAAWPAREVGHRQPVHPGKAPKSETDAVIRAFSWRLLVSRGRRTRCPKRGHLRANRNRFQHLREAVFRPRPFR